MTESVIVWDREGDPPADTTETVLFWRSYANSMLGLSIPRYLEEHAERLRSKYLAFIRDLAETRIGDKRIVEHLDLGDGFSFWWMTQLFEKNPLKSPRIYDCLRLLTLEEILLEKKPAELTLDSPDRALAQAIRSLCQSLWISFVWRPGKESQREWSLRGLYRALPYSMQGLLSLRHLVMRWPLRKLQKPQWFSGDNTLFLCSYFFNLDPTSCAEGRFYPRQWEGLPKYLQDSRTRANWIHHFLPLPGTPDAKTGLSWLRLFNRDSCNQGYHAFLETYLSWRVVYRALGNWLRLNAVSWRLRQIRRSFNPKGSAVWLWPLLRTDWRASLNGAVAISNCLWVTLFDTALNCMPRQKIGLYLCENQGWERALLHAWRKHGHGEIIGVPNTTVPFWWLSYFDDPRGLDSEQNCAMPIPDRLAVNGKVAWRAFAGAGYAVEQLVEVEALRYLGLLRVAPKPDMDSARRFATKPPTSESLEVNVLILGDMVPSSMHNFLSLLEDTMKLLPSGYKLTFKPHPGYTVKLSDYPGLHVSETSAALDRILGEYDIALAVNSTSASVDAYVAGLPVIIGLDGAVLNLSPLRGQPDVRFASTPEEMAEALQTASEGMATNPGRVEFFFLDSELPRWRRLLS